MAVKRWNGTSWEIYAGSDLAPVKVTDGRVGKTTFIGATTPTGMVDGDIWIDQDTATNAVVPTALLAKGDIFVATGNGAYTRLAAGNNGESLYADSSTSTGLRWQGDFNVGKNKIINGGFDIWQRGTSFTANGAHTADRWRFDWNGNGTFTASQQTFTPGAAPVAGYEGTYFHRITANTIGTTTDLNLYYKIEDVRVLSGQNVTFSFWAKADSARTINTWAIQIFGGGGSTDVYTGLNVTPFNLTTSWQRFTHTFTLPSMSGKTIGTNSNLLLLWRAYPTSGMTFDIWGAQLEASSTATPFTTNTGNPQAELAACQRYYVRWDTVNEQVGFYWGNGSAYNRWNWVFPVPMRTAPSISKTGNIAAFNPTFTAQAISTIGGNFSSTRSASVDGNLAGTVGSNGQTYLAYILNSSQFVEASAEL